VRDRGTPAWRSEPGPAWVTGLRSHHTGAGGESPVLGAHVGPLSSRGLLMCQRPVETPLPPAMRAPSAGGRAESDADSALPPGLALHPVEGSDAQQGQAGGEHTLRGPAQCEPADPCLAVGFEQGQAS